MREIDTRTLNDGSQTEIALHAIDGGRFLVTARNAAGESAVVVEAHEAAACYLHPFSRVEWLDYPGVTRNRTAEALELAAVIAAEHREDEAEVNP